jgi:hypothetical protein
METNIEIEPLTPFKEREIFAETRHVFEKTREIFAETKTMNKPRPT